MKNKSEKWLLCLSFPLPCSYSNSLPPPLHLSPYSSLLILTLSISLINITYPLPIVNPSWSSSENCYGKKKERRTAHKQKSHFTLGSKFLSSLWYKKQVTWGYNIVVDGGAKAYHPYSYPYTFHMHIFTLSNSFLMSQQTNWRTDKASYRVACPQLKSV